MREVFKAALKEYDDEELGIVRLRNPWCNVYQEAMFLRNVQYQLVCYASFSMSFLIEADLPTL